MFNPGGDAARTATASSEIARAPETPKTVKVKIDTEPSGAMVRLDGVRKGQTPLELDLTSSTEPVQLMLNLRGYHEASQSLVPDMSQRLFFTLTRRASPKPKRYPSRKSA